MAAEQKIDICGGNNQVLPNATHAVQNVYNNTYIGKEYIGELLLQARMSETPHPPRRRGRGYVLL